MDNCKKLKEVQKIINKYFDILENLPAGKAIDPKIAKKLGIPNHLIPVITNAYKSGKIKANSKYNLTKEDYKSRVKIDDTNKDLLNLQAEQTKEDIVNLLGKNRARLTRTTTDYLKYKMNLIDTVFPNEKMPNNWYASELRKVTKDSRQDWDMVIRSELMNNRLEGEAKALLDGTSPYSNKKGETLVFKRPNPDACKHCKRLYLEKDGITPKVFKLTDLMANGNNIGLKVADWKPTLGIVHPHCQCQLSVMPDNMEFKNGELTIKGGE